MELVKKYHPDRNPNANQDQFKRMTAAYTVLSNEKIKQRYDNVKRGGTHPFSNSQGRSQGSTSYGYQTNQNDQRGQSGYWGDYGAYSNRSSNKRSSYGQQYDARGEYEYKKQQEQYNQQARKEYEEWFKSMKSRAEKQQKTRDDFNRARQQYYTDYEDFKRTFDQKFGDRESNYRQNFEENKNYYGNNAQNSDPYRQYSRQEAQDKMTQLYIRVAIFILIFLLIETTLKKIRHAHYNREMVYRYHQGLERQQISPSLMNNHEHGSAFAYRRTKDQDDNTQFYPSMQGRKN